jgi:hypothetical protein
MVTIDEQRASQLENAEADEKFWTGLQDMNADQAEGHKGLAALASRKAGEAEAGAADAAKKAAIAKERRGRIAEGETMSGGLGKPVDFRKVLLDAGFTKKRLESVEAHGRCRRADYGRRVLPACHEGARPCRDVDRPENP